MTRGKKAWICEDCGGKQYFIQGAAPAPLRLPGLDGLPNLLAIPFHEYATETSPVLQLHRLCDAIEILTRFCTIVAIGEMRRLNNGKLFEAVLYELQQRIEIPTFGKWRGMLDALLSCLPHSAPLVVAELPDFVRQHLLPVLIGGDDQTPDRCLLTLRNLLVHGGGMTQDTAQGLLNGDSASELAGWASWLDQIIPRLGFLASCVVCHYGEKETRRLRGLELAEPLKLSAALGHAVMHLTGHVLLVWEDSDRWLDLWPLCDFGPAIMTSLQGPRDSDFSAPQVFYRAEKVRLLYTALGVDLPMGERRDRVTEFRDLFKLEKRQTPEITRPDYDEEIERDANTMIGRQEELEHARIKIKECSGGVLWLTGPGGIGKSLFVAKLASGYGLLRPELLGRQQSKKWCVIAWRFRATDGDRCNRHAFFRHAISRLGQWEALGRPRTVPTTETAKLQEQLARLFDLVAGLKSEDPRGRPPRVLFMVDGLDEIGRSDTDFAEMLFQLNCPNIVWLCAGRPEKMLNDIFKPERCAHLFADGLGRMPPADIRAMLVEGTGRLKFALLRQDDERGGATTNALVDAVVHHAAGLPLYVRFVVEDIVAGYLAFDEMLPGQLPRGLSAYYDDLLRRFAIGELQALLTPLVVSVCWAKAALDEETLLELMLRRKALLASSKEPPKQTLRRGLGAAGVMLRAVPLPSGEVGYEPYHSTFRDHICADEARIIGVQNDLAREGFCELTNDWAQLMNGHAARHYVLKHGPQHLLDEKRYHEVFRLARDEHGFLLAQMCELPTEPEAPLRTVRAALRLAIEKVDTPNVAELALSHAHRTEMIRGESPLKAWRNGNAERAASLAELAGSDRTLLWLLLLLWNAKETGSLAEITQLRRQLRHHTKQPVTRKDMRYLICVLASVIENRTEEEGFLCQQLLPVSEIENLFNLLLERHSLENAEWVVGWLPACELRDQLRHRISLQWAERGVWWDPWPGQERTFLTLEGEIRAVGELANRLRKEGLLEPAYELLTRGLRLIPEGSSFPKGQAIWLRFLAPALLDSPLLNEAIRIARTISHGKWKGSALYWLAEPAIDAGRGEEAFVVGLLDECHQALLANSDGQWHSEELIKLVQVRVQLGHLDKAMKVASSIEVDSDRGLAEAEVAVGFVRAGKDEFARQLVAKILDSDSQSKAYDRLVNVYLEQDGFSEAERLSELIFDVKRRSGVIERIINAMEKKHDPRAEDLAQRFSEDYSRARVIAELALNRFHRAEAGEGRRLALQAFELCSHISDYFAYVNALKAVAPAIALAVGVQEALDLATHLERSDQGEIVGAIVDQLGLAARFDEALRILNEMESEHARAEATLPIIRSLSAKGLRNQMVQVARQVTYYDWGEKELFEVMVQDAREGRMGDAVRLADELWSDEQRASAHLHLVEISLLQEHGDESRSILSQALRSHPKKPDFEKARDWLFKAFLRKPDLDLALALANQSSEPWDKANVLFWLFQQQKERDQNSGERTLLELERLALAIKDAPTRVSFERQLAVFLFEIGENIAAERHLNAAVESLTLEMGNFEKSNAAQQLLEVLVERLRWDEALEAIGQIPAGFIRVIVSILAKFAEAAFGSGEADIASNALHRARAIIVEAREGFDRTELLSVIGRSAAEAREAFDRAELFAIVGRSAERIGLREMATVSFGVALEAVNAVKDDKRDEAMAHIAICQFESGDFGAGESILKMIGDESEKARILTSLANERLHSGNAKLAIETAHRAKQVVLQITNDHARGIAIVGLISLFIACEELDAARCLLRTLDVHNNPQYKHRMEAVTSVISAYYRESQAITAQEIVEEEINVARDRIVNESIGDYLADLVRFARMLYLLRVPVTAAEHFRFAIELTRHERDAERRSHDLATIAKELVAAGETEWAVEVLGLIESQRDEHFTEVAEILINEPNIRAFLLLVEKATEEKNVLTPLLGMLAWRFTDTAEEIATLLLGSDWIVAEPNPLDATF